MKKLTYSIFLYSVIFCNAADLFIIQNGGTALDVSIDGETVIGYLSEMDCSEGFVYKLSDEELIKIGDLPGGDCMSQLYAISADGTVGIGFSRDGESSKAIKWSETGGIRLFDNSETKSNHYNVSDLSANGEIFVGQNTIVGESINSFVYQNGSYSYSFNGVDLSDDIRIMRISDDGSTFGGQSNRGAVIIDNSNRVQYLPTPDNGFSPYEITDIDESGEVYVGNSGELGDSVGFFYNDQQGTVPLYGLGGSDFGSDYVSYVYRVSSDGKVAVGFSYVDRKRTATMWILQYPEYPINLNDILVASGNISENAYLSRAFSIDGDGSTIVGEAYLDDAYLDNDKRTGFVLSIDSSDIWRRYPVISNNSVVSCDKLGLLYVAEDPWIYAYDLEKWVYWPNLGSSPTGEWLFFVE